jgi:hypothetical protein
MFSFWLLATGYRLLTDGSTQLRSDRMRANGISVRCGTIYALSYAESKGMDVRQAVRHLTEDWRCNSLSNCCFGT